MDRDAHLAALARDGAALLDAASRSGSATVAACPGWSISDLVWHMTGVWTFFGRVVGERLTSIESIGREQRPGDGDLPIIAADRLRTLLDVLGATPDEVPVWTFTGGGTVAFVRRRMAHETAVHRVDAETATGLRASVEPVLASDGIDEFLEVFLPRRATGAPEVAGSVHLHCTDVAGEWTVTWHEERPVVRREHAKGDAAIRGPASDVLLALWRRMPLSALEVLGDGAVAARFVSLARG